MELSELIIRNVVAINRVNRVTGMYTIRNRPQYALCYKLSGHTVYTQHGKSFVSDRNHIVIVPCGATYQYFCQELGECVLLEFETVQCEPHASVRSYAIPNAAEVATLLHALERMFTFRKPGYLPYCISGLYRLFYYMLSQDETHYVSSAKKLRIQPGLDYLETHYQDSALNSQRMADASGISDVYFRKLFAEVYGMPPQRYVSLIRMAKAKDLLLSHEFQVQEIATEVGYHDVYSFCKAFRKAFACTPTEYRRRSQP